MMGSFIQLIRCCVYLPFTALVKYNIQHPRFSETLPPFNFFYFFFLKIFCIIFLFGFLARDLCILLAALQRLAPVELIDSSGCARADVRLLYC